MAPAKQAKIIQEFQTQSAKMDITVRCCKFQSRHKFRNIVCVSTSNDSDFSGFDSVIYVQTEMMSDAIDDVLDNDEAEEETEDLTNQVLRTSSHFSVFKICAAISGELKLHYFPRIVGNLGYTFCTVN
jgi:charged multivesicular body protein 2B